MRSLTLRARLTLWYLATLLVVLSVFGAQVVWQQGRIGLGRVDRELDDATATLTNMLQDELNEMSDPAAAAAEVKRLMAAPGRAVVILDADGRVLAASWSGLSMSAESAGQSSGRGDSEVWTAETPSGAWRVHSDRRSFGGPAYRLLVAAPLADVLRERRQAQEAMLVAIPIALLLAAAGGMWLSSVGLRPVTAMAHRAGNLAPTGMEDLGESDRRDELGQLSRAFNGLVARLREALRTQRQFMADASHELRTPVSVIQSAADVTLSRDHRDECEYREALDIAGTEARRLGRLVEDMLVLARADAGGYPLRRVSLYIDELVSECRRTVDVLARDRTVSVTTSAHGEVPFVGDEDLLRRMLVNVVQNAVQHTRPGGRVAINVGSDAARVTIDVSDEGPGLLESDRQRIFDRFVQLDPSRRSNGTGLGLPIARWIAEAHGGEVTVQESGPSGSTFRIVLPVTQGARPS